jgi:hypothetical protein
MRQYMAAVAPFTAPKRIQWLESIGGPLPQIEPRVSLLAAGEAAGPVSFPTGGNAASAVLAARGLLAAARPEGHRRWCRLCAVHALVGPSTLHQ